MWASYILASLNFVLYVHHQSDYVGCSNDTVMVATEDGLFFPVCIGGIPAQRILRGTESLEPCSAYRKGLCLRCRFWQFSIFQISLTFRKESPKTVGSGARVGQMLPEWVKGSEFRNAPSSQGLTVLQSQATWACSPTPEACVHQLALPQARAQPWCPRESISVMLSFALIPWGANM